MFLIVPLGNPGEEYKKTRHNAGRIIVDEIVEKSDWDFSKAANAFFYKTKILDKEVQFLKPETFMNASGCAVSYIFKKKNIKSGELIVIHDDIDLPIGEYRVSFNSGSAGHNGIESIINSIDTKEFYRIRIGVSPKDEDGNTRRPTGGEQGDFVLKNFSKVDFEKIVVLKEKVLEEIEKII